MYSVFVDVNAPLLTMQQFLTNSKKKNIACYNVLLTQHKEYGVTSCH